MTAREPRTMPEQIADIYEQLRRLHTAVVISGETSGIPGRNGTDGEDGRDGRNGTDGTDGTDGATGPAGPAVPTHMLDGETFTVPDRQGMTFAWDIVMDGSAAIVMGSESELVDVR